MNAMIAIVRSSASMLLKLAGLECTVFFLIYVKWGHNQENCKKNIGICLEEEEEEEEQQQQQQQQKKNKQTNKKGNKSC